MHACTQTLETRQTSKWLTNELRFYVEPYTYVRKRSSWSIELFVLPKYKVVNKPWSANCVCVCPNAYVASEDQALHRAHPLF